MTYRQIQNNNKMLKTLYNDILTLKKCLNKIDYYPNNPFNRNNKHNPRQSQKILKKQYQTNLNPLQS